MNKVSIRLKNGTVDYAQKTETLLAGSCDAFFPMSIIRDKKNTRGIFDTSGFHKLADLEGLSASQVLSLAEDVLLLIEKCEDYLFFPEEYILSAETVYINEESKKLKLIYIPNERKASFFKSLAYFFHQMKSVTTENGRVYLDTLSALLSSGNLRTERVIGFIEKLKQEIYLCGIR